MTADAGVTRHGGLSTGCRRRNHELKRLRWRTARCAVEATRRPTRQASLLHTRFHSRYRRTWSLGRRVRSFRAMATAHQVGATFSVHIE